jgi:metal-responsive CopG/Arc/MetJ family transcriptional regulator
LHVLFKHDEECGYPQEEAKGNLDMKKRVHCRFEEDLLDRVDRAAALLGLNRTELIKLSCNAYLSKHDYGKREMNGK